MYLELNEKIERAQQGIARLNKIGSMLKTLELEQEKLGSKEGELKVILEKENYDVEKFKKYEHCFCFLFDTGYIR